MSAAGQYDRERQSTERWMRFLDSSDVKSVASRHKLWRETAAGQETVANLNTLAVMRLQELLTQDDYEVAVWDSATEHALPLPDMHIMAEGAYEARRCYYIAAELIPVAYGDWYHAEEVGCGN